MGQTWWCWPEGTGVRGRLILCAAAIRLRLRNRSAKVQVRTLSALDLRMTETEGPDEAQRLSVTPLKPLGSVRVVRDRSSIALDPHLHP